MKLPPLHFHFASPDGYIRVPEAMLNRLTLAHVSSGIDAQLLADLRADAIEAFNAGYTEWQGAIHPLTSHFSVGWDWYIERTSGAFLIAWDDVRSNLMGVDRSGTDLGMACTAQALIRRLIHLNWSHAVAATVALRASGQQEILSPVYRH